MTGISVGLSCPTCGGAISIPEGENIIPCQYCGSTLFVEGDQGVSTIAFSVKMQKDNAMGATQQWWRRGWKARDLPRMGRMTETYPIFLPFWKANTKVAGWICGYEERRHTDSKGNVRVERIPKEVMILQDYVYSEIACDPGDLGIRTLRNLSGETGFADFEMIPTFEATTSKDDAIVHAKNDAEGRAVAGARVPHITFKRLHIFPKSLTMIYYPVWVVRYSYHDRMYMATVDGVTGQVLSGRAPGDPLFQSMAMTGGAVVGGLVAAGTIIASGVDYLDDGRLALVGVAIGLGILFLAYRFFRHGSERIEGEFKDKKGTMKQTLQQMQGVAKQLEGLR
jgi:DNA-directed RNA polymerase subunit RPC12/RpoP